MSSPENVLSRYRSYAYHQILIACDSTTTAQELQVKQTVTELQRLRQNNTNKDTKFGGMSVAGGPGDNYVVLIDGLVDSEFVINKASWQTIIAPQDTGQQMMAQLNGTLEVYEPYGAVFLERLVDVCDTLGTDPTGLVFLLKTVFVGFNDGYHQYNQEVIPNVKPLLFYLVDITSVMDETGSTYTLSVNGTQNGFGQLPMVSHITKGFSLEINKGDSLVATLALVQNIINQEYDEYTKMLELSFAKRHLGPVFNNGNTDFNSSAGAGNFRPVRYKIDASDYTNSKFLAGTNELDRNNSDTDKVTIQFGINTTPEEVIKRVMESSKGVTDEASNKNGKAIFKINSFLRSTPTEMVVEYQVTRYRMITATVENVRNKTAVDLGPSPNVRIYDYIFTGNNTDIIEFDIKMNMGLAFFHTAATTSFEIDQTSGKRGNPSELALKHGTPLKISKTGKSRGKTPLFLGDKISNTKVRNKVNKLSTSNFNALVQKHAALENIAVKMTINGDPSLMSEMLVTDVTDAVNATTKQTYMTAPALIKVNIKMPDGGSNPRTFRQFWYDGYYMLQAVESTFDGGKFTQVLSMFSIPVTSTLDENTDPIIERVDGKTNNDTGDSIATTVNGSAEDALLRDIMNDILGKQ